MNIENLLLFFFKHEIDVKIVGGRALGIFLNTNGLTTTGWKHSDVDIYTVKSFDRYWPDLKEYLKIIFEKIYPNIEFLLAVSEMNTDNKKEEYNICCKCHKVLLVNKSTNMVVWSMDVMHSGPRDITTLLSSFDLNICEIGVDFKIKFPTKNDIEESFFTYANCVYNRYGSNGKAFPKNILRKIYDVCMEYPQSVQIARIVDTCFYFGDHWNSMAALNLEPAKFISTSVNKHNIIKRLKRKRKYENRGFKIDEKSLEISENPKTNNTPKIMKITHQPFNIYT